MKYLQKLRKKQTQTSLVCTEYAVLDEQGNLKGNFKTLKETTLFLEKNPSFKGYEFKTYQITTSNKL